MIVYRETGLRLDEEVWGAPYQKFGVALVGDGYVPDPKHAYLSDVTHVIAQQEIVGRRVEKTSQFHEVRCIADNVVFSELPSGAVAHHVVVFRQVPRAWLVCAWRVVQDAPVGPRGRLTLRWDALAGIASDGPTGLVSTLTYQVNRRAPREERTRTR